MSQFEQTTHSRPNLPVVGHRVPHGNVRRRGRDRWQARVYVGGRKGGAVHLGMYESETAANQVAKRVLKVLTSGGVCTTVLGPLGVWKASQKLVANGFDIGGELATLLPRWVCMDGRGGYGYRVRGGKGCDKGGFETVEEAYAEAVRVRGATRLRRAKVLMQLSLLSMLTEGVGDESITGDVAVSMGEKVTRCVRAKKSERNVSRHVQYTFNFDDNGEAKSAVLTKSNSLIVAERSGVGREIAA